MARFMNRNASDACASVVQQVQPVLDPLSVVRQLSMADSARHRRSGARPSAGSSSFASSRSIQSR